MLTMVRIAKAGKQNGICGPAKLLHVGISFIAKGTKPRPIRHNRARRAQALEVIRPVTGITDDHVRIALSLTTHCAWFSGDGINGTRSPEIHQAGSAPGCRVSYIAARGANIQHATSHSICKMSCNGCDRVGAEMWEMARQMVSYHILFTGEVFYFKIKFL
jgi:hypothetical protein